MMTCEKKCSPLQVPQADEWVYELWLCTKNTSWALIERPYSCAPQAVGAVYDRPGFFVQSPQRLNISSRRCASIRDTSEKFGDSEQFLAVQKLLTVPEFFSRQFLRVAVLAFRSSRAPQPP